MANLTEYNMPGGWNDPDLVGTHRTNTETHKTGPGMTNTETNKTKKTAGTKRKVENAKKNSGRGTQHSTQTKEASRIKTAEPAFFF